MKRYLLFVITLGSVQGWSQQFLPWVTFNEQFYSEIAVNNLSAEVQQLTFTATRANGETQIAERQLNPGQLWVESPGQLFPAMAAGQGFSVRIDSENPGIHAAFRVIGLGSASGSSPAQGNAVDMSDASQFSLFHYLPVPEMAPANAAVVVVNVSDSPANVVLHGFTSNGKLGEVTWDLAAQHPRAALITDLFPSAADPVFVIAESDRSVVGTAFLFNELLEPSMANAEPLTHLPSWMSEPAPITVSSLTLGQSLSIENLVIAEDGSMYAVEGYANSRAFHISADGSQIDVITSSLNGPNGIARDSKGNLFITEYNANRLSKIDTSGSVIPFATLETGPQNVTVDAADNVYVSYWGSGNGNGNKITKITPEGDVSTFAQGISVPNGLSFGPDGFLYVVTTYGGLIKRISPDGVVSDYADLPGNGIIGGSMVWVENKMYVTGVYGHQVFMVEDGTASLLAGTGTPGDSDGPALEASFESPLGIAYHADKKQLYVTSVGFATPVIRLIQLN